MTELQRIFSAGETCVAGYNNLRFDDEFLRHAFYRNLFDPYAREWRDGNSRWDLIDLARAAGGLRPEGIEWPTVDGVPTFSLEALAEANGLVHGVPHDALSDVQATIALAKLIREKQPKLFDYGLTLRSKNAVRRLLVPFGKQLCVHASRRIGNARYCTAPVVSVAQHPTMDNGIIVADLGRDVTQLVEGSAEELRELLFAPDVEERPPLKQVRLNRCPFVAPIGVVRPEDAKRLDIDLDLVEERRAALLATEGLAEKIARVYLRGAGPRAPRLRAPCVTTRSKGRRRRNATWRSGSTTASRPTRTGTPATGSSGSYAPRRPGRRCASPTRASPNLQPGCASGSVRPI